MLLSKINSFAHLRAAPCNDLHATKLAPGEQPPNPGIGEGRTPRVAVGDSRAGTKSPVSAPLLGKEKEPLESQYQVGPLLGSGGFGSVYSGIRVADNLPVSARPAVERARRAGGARVCFGPGEGRSNGDSPGVISRWPSSTWRRTGFPTGESW